MNMHICFYVNRIFLGKKKTLKTLPSVKEDFLNSHPLYCLNYFFYHENLKKILRK